MKKTALIILICGVAMIVHGQNQLPPKEVQDSFAKKFKSAMDIKWEQEKNEWEAEFKMNGTCMSASFDNAGQWLETETEIDRKDLPAEIHKAINLKFNGWEIDEIESIEKPGYAGYEIELEKGNTETEIQVTASGEITIEKVKVEDDDDEEDEGDNNDDD
jgi:hypothetical protein